MKRTKEKEDKAREIEESSALFSDQITKEMKTGADNVVIEPSIARCKGITDGRLSYQGMNPEIERLMEMKLLKSQGKTKEIVNADVTDTEMANFNLHVNKAIAKRFMTKNERQIKKTKFMKPDD
ncbi:M-phase phosphoprotein 6 isoform X2 [Lycorma delicatula]